MGKLATREEVLKALNIDNFREMTSEKVIGFASMYNQINPEVAKAAIAQFPNFAKTVGDALVELKDIAIKGLEGDDENTRMALQARINTIESMQNILERDDLSFEEEQEIINKMSEEASKMEDQVAEGKRFKNQQLQIVALAMIGMSAILLAVLGGKGEISLPQLSDD